MTFNVVIETKYKRKETLGGESQCGGWAEKNGEEEEEEKEEKDREEKRRNITCASVNH